MAGLDERDVDDHMTAAEAFVRRINDGAVRGLESLVLFGSTARNEAAGFGSDVDFLAIISDDADRPTTEEHLREIAYDVMLEYGPVVEVHVLSRSTFEQRRDHPFVRRVVREGVVCV